MAASHTSSSSNHHQILQSKYDVFLSFRGEDTRNNFTDHLHAALIRNGFVAFKDDETLDRGNEISSELSKAIEESNVSIVILSKNYASSPWCLDELAKIVECGNKRKDSKVFAVFYGVDPADVRKQKGEDFERAFAKYEEEFKENQEKVLKWRAALTRVASLAGWHLQDRRESELIKDIVKEISKRLNPTFPSAVDGLVGIASRMEKMNGYLEAGLDDVRFIGICGMGGIGKTTLAKVLYNTLKDQFEASSFLANVREVSVTRGLVPLQEQLLSEVLMERNLIIWDVHKGINLIRWRLCRKRVLVVLDDVDQLEQLQALAGNHDWFGFGSRIIITTRDEHVLKGHGVTNIYKVRGLDYVEALQLFHLKVSKGKQPTDDRVELSKCVVNYAGGLPLAIEVLGSFLCGRSVEEWKSSLNRLQEAPNEKVLKVLRISYDGLDKRDKEIFLDIACFFKGKDKDRVRKKLDSCVFNSVIGIRELLDKSLITIVNNKLWMHDLLQEMGWEIVREHHSDKPGKWSRLWLYKDVYHVLSKYMGTDAVEAIIVDVPEMTELEAKSFSTMSNLRLLEINNLYSSGNLEYLSNNLRYLKWHEYPFNSLPVSFRPEKLFKLNLCNSRIKYLWKGIKPLKELKFMNLSHSCNLIRTPDFTGVPNLERLNLEGCTRLLESLKILCLCGCLKLEKLPQDLGEVECLEELDVGGTAIRQIPPSIVQLVNLKIFSLHGCKGQPPKILSSNFFLSLLLPNKNSDSMCLSFPRFTGLSSLQTLDLSDCNLLEGAIPSDIGSLFSLEAIDLSGNNFFSLPSSINQLLKLKILCLEKCRNLKSLPELPPEIVFVGAEDCTSLETISAFAKLSRSPNIALNFLNCFKLVEDQVSKDNLAVTLMKQWLLEVPNCSSQFHIFLPGNEIPRWFRFRNIGGSVTMTAPRLDNFIGFAVCAVLSLPRCMDRFYSEIQCKLLWGEDDYKFSVAIPSFTTLESDHLWLAYLPRETFKTQCFRGLTKASFNIFYMGEEFRNASVKMCGVVSLYMEVEDTVYMGQQLWPPIWNPGPSGLRRRGFRNFYTLSWLEGNAARSLQPSARLGLLFKFRPSKIHDI
ncbi:ADP-ribosyl cyclase/cyclic ADP-ribose hydrolase [Citrus sinensis]|uniref:ADP-ribosyl cyclase/cyclic ADP-ribose hydrolase n=1 Tax=Citrus sinensis TaxID=2711 RepID=A0ACB8KAE1_CITSI|nr:ADP-ribosyl cyclase/cyclic ADP-ribose hydrolase [Citrus sinensis]